MRLSILLIIISISLFSCKTITLNDEQIIANIPDDIELVKIPAGIYTSATLATHIKAQMKDAGSNTYTVTYNYITSKFTIVTSGAFLTLEWTGTNSYRTTALLLGFRIEADDTGATTYTSHHSVHGIPGD